MNDFVQEIMNMTARNEQIIILMLNQSKISDDFECLMAWIQTLERAIPIAWKVVKTKESGV
ncbi:hypothetical protein P618_200176 [Holospora obtusa F1]|uniref:Uncharacterized protein n=1 Tax=Holospora obtusa F1 TaxID=1399147 RepID=W6TF82_HOLOB|nr:hypothetical protein [Holospora obtusa]ETZ07636.1 hypothetical protein P618_200176 [Holospora obtusa F1]